MFLALFHSSLIEPYYNLIHPKSGLHNSLGGLIRKEVKGGGGVIVHRLRLVRNADGLKTAQKR